VLWLLNSAKHENLEVTYDLRFMQAAAFCIVGEGKSDIWWDMLTIEHVPKLFGDAAVANPSDSRARWHSALLAPLFQAQMFWTTVGSIWNAPLATFRRLVHFRRHSNPPIVIGGAVTFLHTKLPTYGSAADRQNINVEDFEAFVSFQNSYTSGSLHLNLYETGLLALTHPVHQRAGPLLDFFHEAESNTARLDYIMGMPGSVFWMVMRMLMQCAYRAGLTADVRWTIYFYWKIQRERKKLESQGLVQRNAWAKFTRRAHPGEIERGVEVDAEGRVVVRDRKETFEEVQKREKALTSKGHRLSAYRTNPTASRGVRAFSTGSRCTEAPPIRKIIIEPRDAAESPKGNISWTKRSAKNDMLTDQEYRKWIKYPRKPSAPDTVCRRLLFDCT
jgi:hypothetical protein